MDCALFLAGRARGRTTPNPLVGAVVVTPAGVVAGTGYHERAGAPHAEVHALRAAGDAARGSTLYCTLEPCSHVGRTPPCVDGILGAGVRRVVAAVQDPDPRVAGRGVQQLRQAGVQVDVGVGGDAAVRLNRPFFSVMQRGRPFVIAKAATSLDGRVAAAPGAGPRMSSAPADRRSQSLRAEVDAIAIGSATLLVDDPRLTVREVFRERPLARVIFDRRLRTRPSARVFATRTAGPIIIVTTAAGMADDSAAARALEGAGAMLIAVREGVSGALAALLPLGIHSVLLEGGPTLQAAFWREHVVDAVRLIVTPRVAGPGGVPWLDGSQVPWATLAHVEVQPCGDDTLIEADVYWTDRTRGPCGGTGSHRGRLPVLD
jgi:diaminohydroxyphosphoribosylaminopyrimidine deaminase/5-amino-6-(5-phosphoribosylamino)uracil reductase